MVIRRTFVIECDTCSYDDFDHYKATVIRTWRADGGSVNERTGEARCANCVFHDALTQPDTDRKDI